MNDINIDLLNPIATIEDLPMENNYDGDLIICLQDKKIYEWKESTSSWNVYSEDNDSLVGSYSYLVKDINLARINTNINSNYLTNNTYLNESKLGPKDYSLIREENMIILTLSLSYSLDIGDRILIEYFKTGEENPDEPENPEVEEDPEIGDIIRENHTHDDMYLQLNQDEIKFENESYIGYDDESNKLYIRKEEDKDYVYSTNNKPTLDELGYVRPELEGVEFNYSPSVESYEDIGLELEANKAVSAYTFNSVYTKVNDTINNSLLIEKDLDIKDYNNPFKPEIWEELNRISDFKINSEKETETITRTKKKYIKPSENIQFEYICPPVNESLNGEDLGYLLIGKLEFNYGGLIKLNCEVLEDNPYTSLLFYYGSDSTLNKSLKTAEIGEFIANNENGCLNFMSYTEEIRFYVASKMILLEIKPGDTLHIFINKNNVGTRNFNVFSVGYDIFEK